MMKIKDYDGNLYLVHLEEKEDDIRWMIRYDDHGDEFILVHCNDGTNYQYGWFKDRKYTDHYTYIRDHELFAPNKQIIGRFENPEYHYGLFVLSKPFYPYKSQIGVYGKTAAQCYFDDFIISLDKSFEKGFEYNFEGFDYNMYMSKYSVICIFLEKNGIDTVENLEKLIKAPMHSKRVDGCRGIAAKRLYKSDTVNCDNLSYVYVGGKWIYQWGTPLYRSRSSYDDTMPRKSLPPFDISHESYCDDWGESIYFFNIQDIDNALSQTRLIF